MGATHVPRGGAEVLALSLKAQPTAEDRARQWEFIKDWTGRDHDWLARELQARSNTR